MKVEDLDTPFLLVDLKGLSEYTVRGLSEATRAAGTSVGVVIELAHGRTGVESPAAAADLGGLVDSLPGLEMCGLMIMPLPPVCRPLLQEALAALDARGVGRLRLTGQARC